MLKIRLKSETIMRQKPSLPQYYGMKSQLCQSPFTGGGKASEMAGGKREGFCTVLFLHPGVGYMGIFIL